MRPAVALAVEEAWAEPPEEVAELSAFATAWESDDGMQ